MKVVTLRQPELHRAVPLVLAAQAEQGHDHDAAWAENMLRDLLAHNLGRLLVAEHEGEPVGYLALAWGYSLTKAAPFGEVQDVFVRADRRGGRVAQRLLAAAEETARRYGACRLQLHAGASNVGARRAYGRAGFERTERDVYIKLLP